MRIGGARTQLSDPRSHAFIVLIGHHWWGAFLRWAEGLHGPVFCYPVGRLGRHLEENPHSQDITLGDINSPLEAERRGLLAHASVQVWSTVPECGIELKKPQAEQ